VSIQEKDVLAALSRIIDPDFKQDIVTLGFIRNMKIEGSTVGFDIQLTTPACPIKDQFKAEAERVVGELSGVETVNVTMTSAKTQRTPKVARSGLTEVQAIIAVASGKGGVGKSTVAACLAREVARRGYRVGLLDTDIFGPSVPTLFNLHDQHLYQNDEEMIMPVETGEISVMSFGFWLGESPAIMRGPMVSSYIQQFLHQVAWGRLDYLFLDLPPGTGDIQLTITQAVELDGAVIVTTPQALSYADVGKGIVMFDRVDVPVLGVIENMAYFVCDECGKKHPIFGEGGARRLADRFGIEVLGQLPLSPGEYGGTFEEVNEIPEISSSVDTLMMALGRATLEGIRRPSVEYDDKKITLTWENGETVTVSNHALRASCECALCVDEHTGEPILDPATIPPDIRPDEVKPIGNYAISITWSDGHSTGLYPYKKIKALAASG
jgi:ATP-binding protein involved in chromosome partitioning